MRVQSLCHFVRARPRGVGRCRATRRLPTSPPRAIGISARRCTTRSKGHFFEALERLDAELGQHRGVDEPALDSLYRNLREAEFSVGDFELNYRMHHRAGRAITAVLEGAVDEVVRNDAAYRLARIHFQKGQLEDALHALDRIVGRVPDEIVGRHRVPAREHVHGTRPSRRSGRGPEAAAERRRARRASRRTTSASRCSRTIGARTRSRSSTAPGRSTAATKPCSRFATSRTSCSARCSSRTQQFERAKQSFDRVRLEGPFSNSALLASGWAATAGEDYERAVVPWTLLAERESTDAAVQEAQLALPFAYGKLDVHGRAALLYAKRARLVRATRSSGSTRR